MGSGDRTSKHKHLGRKLQTGRGPQLNSCGGGGKTFRGPAMALDLNGKRHSGQLLAIQEQFSSCENNLIASMLDFSLSTFLLVIFVIGW